MFFWVGIGIPYILQLEGVEGVLESSFCLSSGQRFVQAISFEPFSLL